MSSNHQPDTGLPWIDSLRDQIRQLKDTVSEQAVDLTKKVITIRNLEHDLSTERAARQDAERAKFGTPCRCESWIASAGDAEDRAQALQDENTTLKLKLRLYENASTPNQPLIDDIDRWLLELQQRDKEARYRDFRAGAGVRRPQRGVFAWAGRHFASIREAFETYLETRIPDGDDD